MKTRLSLFLASLVLCGSVPLSGQSAAGVSTQTLADAAAQTAVDPADKAAIAIVQNTLTAMGGDTWKGLQAATVHSTRAITGGRAVSVTTTTDWGRGAVLHRKETTTTTEFVSGPYRGTVSSGKVWMAPANYDLSDLAELYPAAALRLGLERRCKLHQIAVTETPEKAKQGAISMTCLDQSYPHSGAHFFWRIGADGLPAEVEVPVLSMDGRFELHRTFRFEGYHAVQGLTLPSTVRTIQGGIVLSTETVSDVSFQASLPDTTFTPQAQK